MFSLQVVATLAVFLLEFLAEDYAIPVETPDSKLGMGQLPIRLVSHGREAKLMQFPYQTALFGMSSSNFCGGVLISESYILTAAHCVENEFLLFVVIGELELPEHYCGKFDCRYITKEDIFIHPNWSDVFCGADVALLRVRDKIQLSEKIWPIELPTRLEAKSKLGGKIALAIGWGATEREESPSELRYSNLTILADEDCFGEAFICTDARFGHGICKGDSGGPLVLETADERGEIVIGIASAGNGGPCGRKRDNVPSVFTKVGYYLDWISNTTGIEIDYE